MKHKNKKQPRHRQLRFGYPKNKWLYQVIKILGDNYHPIAHKKPIQIYWQQGHSFKTTAHKIMEGK